MPNNPTSNSKAYQRLLKYGINDPILAQTLQAQGLPLIETETGLYRLKTALNGLSETLFCIVDIETNGSKPQHHQIIEIGAVLWRNGVILERFESLVQCEEILEHIQAITGIHPHDTAQAPSLYEVMQRFRLFLGEAVFVAHDVKFDYGFVSSMMAKVRLLELANRPLCTIHLAERLYPSERYGLGYLNDTLSLYPQAQHHRALSDALTTTHLFNYLWQMLPPMLHTAEELIRFSREAPKLTLR